MNMPTISLETPATAAPAAGLAASAASLPASDCAFADRLALAFEQLPVGQNLAAGLAPLQTLALGPTLEVVTTPAATPDGDSLARFAKAQGLDDEVVAWLFGAPGQAPLGAWPVPGMPGAIAPTAAPAAGTMAPAVTGASAAALTAHAAGAVGAAAVPAAGLSAEAAASVLALVPPPANWLQQADTAARAVPAPAPGAQEAADPLVPVMPFNLAAAVASPALVARAAGAPAQPTAQVPADVPVEVLTLVVEPELEALWDAPAPGSLAADTLEQTPDSALPVAAAGGHAGQAATEDAPLASTAGQRAAGYEALAERVGEALAQRVLSQVERGQWQVRLLLKPAKLGEVEIDLRMQGGELDASFRAANPVTRDLLNDGLSRLREVLSGAGMEIADLNVASGRSQQHGGNPTPRQSGEPSHAPTGGQAGTQEAAEAAVSPAARRSPGSDWDVLV